ncbi:hypothetical protein HELRODRAFT_175819 [Helobdella robusta]|uniref:Uncharacterized protein n=1 Tax=Helobdella robusta TaxID=6412 RepID=T1F9Q2_HELRO|nr:hypothetical protein HELRODRAFT_175819 [Helobdella robusta]ESO00401.1 hypothetical protein HELRODRAFT_175819 [Helobdella robusta]
MSTHYMTNKMLCTCQPICNNARIHKKHFLKQNDTILTRVTWLVIQQLINSLRMIMQEDAESDENNVTENDANSEDGNYLLGLGADSDTEDHVSEESDESEDVIIYDEKPVNPPSTTVTNRGKVEQMEKEEIEADYVVEGTHTPADVNPSTLEHFCDFHAAAIISGGPSLLFKSTQGSVDAVFCHAQDHTQCRYKGMNRKNRRPKTRWKTVSSVI